LDSHKSALSMSSGTSVDTLLLLSSPISDGRSSSSTASAIT
jgi:hypothetical protein